MPNKNHFISEWNVQLRSSQKKLADIMRTRVFQCLPAFYAKMEETDDKIFLEPLLFAYFALLIPESISLEQLLAGSIVNPGNSEHILVCSDDQGVIYLPSMGYLKTGIAHELFTLIWDTDLQCYELKKDGLPAVFDFELPYCARRTGIELVSDSHLLVRPFLEAESKRKGNKNDKTRVPVFAGRAELVNHWKPLLEKALELLGRIWPDYLEEVKSVVRKVVFFEEETLRSFAPSRLHGCIFLNCREAKTELAIIEALSICTSQLQFYLFTLERERFFRVNSEALMVWETKSRNRHLSIYEGMEELVISNRQTEVLEALYRSKYLDDDMRREIIGRFAYNRYRHQAFFDKMNLQRLFTERGVYFYKEMIIQRAEIYASLEEVLADIQVQNQSQVFSLKLFNKLNAVPELIENY